jgi:hypothetical protein
MYSYFSPQFITLFFYPCDLFRQRFQTKARKEFHLICLLFAESITEEVSIYYVQVKLRAEFIVM